jgi:hypothetical protein
LRFREKGLVRWAGSAAGGWPAVKGPRFRPEKSLAAGAFPRLKPLVGVVWANRVRVDGYVCDAGTAATLAPVAVRSALPVSSSRAAQVGAVMIGAFPDIT